MLPAAQRLHEGSVFRDVTRRGRRSSSRLLVAYLLETDVADAAAPARVGFIVSKAVGNAVVRNRVQRRLRHAVRAMVPGLPAGSVLVVRALPASAVAEYAALQDQLGRAVLRLTSVPVA